MYKTTIYYNKCNFLGGWGFCDLYDTDSGEVWELKRVTVSFEKAKDQLKKYTNGRLKRNLDLPLKTGGFLFEGKREFSVSDDDGTYKITYWQGEDGILWYDYVYEKEDSKKKTSDAAVAVTIASSCAVALVVGSISQGVNSNSYIGNQYGNGNSVGAGVRPPLAFSRDCEDDLDLAA